MAKRKKRPMPSEIVVRQSIEAYKSDPNIKAWHEWLDRRVTAGAITETTRTSYKVGMKVFYDWFQKTGKEASKDLVEEWFASMRASGLKRATASVYLAGVRSFFKWAVRQKIVPESAAHELEIEKRKRSQSHLREALTDQEVKRVLALPDRTDPIGKRDYAILVLMLYAGARTVEVHRANIEDLLTRSNKLVLKVQGKGRDSADEVLVLSNPIVEAAMRNWRSTLKRKSGALFTSLSDRSTDKRLSLSAIRHIIKAYMNAAGVVGYKTTHSLRHTAITSAIRNGAPIQKVQSMARHADVSTTMIYFHEVDRVDNPAEDFISYGE